MAQVADWKKAIQVESRVANIMARQERQGVWFDTQRAKWYIHLLTERILHIDLVAVPLMPKLLVVNGNISRPYKKDGSKSVALLKWLENNPEASVGGPFTAISYEPFDFGKVGLFKDWMLKNGWIPDEWNTKNLTINSLGKKLTQEEQGRVLNGYIQDLRESASGPLRIKLLGIKKGTTVGELKKLLLKRKIVPTGPKITETSLETIETAGLNHPVDTPLGKLVQQRMVWSHRRSLLEGLVNSVRSDHRLPARANPCATPTARMRHAVVVNIPAGRSPFGKELRSLFRGSPGMVFVGYDAAALELRMFAHYLNNEEYTRQVTTGDIHTHNQHAAGLQTRDQAKTFLYSMLYGAGPTKIGSIIGGTSKDGAEIKERFMGAIEGMKELLESVENQAEMGYLIGLDGRKLWMRRNEAGEVMKHKALNTLLQAAGAIVMKYAAVWLDGEIKRLGLRAYPVIFMHDEQQFECHPEDVDKLKGLMDNCLRVAGEYLKMNCPLASDSKSGRDWYATH